ncbi:serine hydrolase domain-containing protein [Pelagovum pacificum]|uniref:Serine hydrolase n=1 Tax=Pelagovum pacificum TaxID=2588711 RepID=A0A5C5GGS2_9RHOB|nr:serine hydrolase [Pelagovum pacificum]QQA42924.1 serine hydrolase [Pelagovum pacificum]TNY33932.1 serine hydrolase [Pelagovum pacificum]
MITRRTTLALLAAAPLSARAQAMPQGWADLPSLAAELDQFHAIAVAHRGELVLEEAVRGPSVDTPANIKSVSKTIVAGLLGSVLQSGEIADISATLEDVAPNLIPGDADPRVGSISMEDLVTLRAGLERTSGPNYGNWVASGNWVANALGREFVDEPGGRMLYSTGTTHVLGAALSEATGDSLLTLARDRLGDVLGTYIVPWTQDPQGRYMGGNQMALTPAAMVRFGELYRLGGSYDGTRVLPEDYVTASFEQRTRSPYSGLSYGYGWFLGEVQGHPYAMARGYGGQIIFVVPEAELTVAITSDPNQPARSDGYFGVLRDFLEQTVAPLALSA